MLSSHDQLSSQMLDRLKTTSIGLGLVRLLQDARRFEEARTTLYALETGFRVVELEPNVASQLPCKATRLRSMSRRFSFIAPTAVNDLNQSHT
jgi:hypothetical protein